jgi:hypothetical protein
LETFTEIKDFVDNPHFSEQRRKSLSKLDFNTIDAPIAEIIKRFSKLPYCFTLQSCYGHFLYHDQRDPHNIESLPISNKIKKVEYRIAYIAFCIKNSESGIELFHDLSKIIVIDPEYLQFGCAEWFWKRQVNSYALQVEPKRFMTKDKVTIPYDEALYIQNVRDKFLDAIKKIVQVKG